MKNQISRKQVITLVVAFAALTLLCYIVIFLVMTRENDRLRDSWEATEPKPDLLLEPQSPDLSSVREVDVCSEHDGSFRFRVLFNSDDLIIDIYDSYGSLISDKNRIPVEPTLEQIIYGYEAQGYPECTDQ